MTHPWDPVAFVIRLQANLGPQPLARALRRSNRQTDCGRSSLAYYLFDTQDRGVHQLLGFASAAHFAVEKLDMKRRTARDLPWEGHWRSCPSSSTSCWSRCG